MDITKTSSLKGEITVPGDKSISHRSIMIGSLAEGVTEVRNFLMGEDCLSSMDCFKKMGVDISIDGDLVKIKGVGMRGLKKPEEMLYAGNSGTTVRLISGILSAQNFECSLDGDSSIRKRPMKRILDPLTLMGADIKSINDNGCAPLKIVGSNLKGISYSSPIASAQVKSAILLAGLYADGVTTVIEPVLSRNHTELMLKAFGADVKTEGATATVTASKSLKAVNITVPGDISSAAFFMVAGLIVPDSEVLIKNVGINPTRDGMIEIIKKMGGNIEILNKRLEGFEETADILVKTSDLKGIVIEGGIIPRIIDEIPVIAIMAACAQGETIIRDAEDLKNKESDRIRYMAKNLQNMGGDITPTDDGMIIRGRKPLKGCVIDTCNDHRIAMSFAIAGLVADGKTEIPEDECINISYPGFKNNLNLLLR